MKFTVVEMQNGNIGNNQWDFNDQNEAESKYYATVSAAAVSDVHKHAVVLLNDNGFCIMSRCYTHGEEVAS